MTTTKYSSHLAGEQQQQVKRPGFGPNPHIHSRTHQLVCRSGTHANRIKWKLQQSLLKTDSSTSQAIVSIAPGVLPRCGSYP